jgi:hypothetical protein
MSKLRSDQPPAPSLERAYRDAYTALSSVVDDQTTRTLPAAALSVDDLVGEFERVASEARMIWTRELGPRMSWQAPFLGRDCDWELRMQCIDLDSGGRGDDPDAFMTNELALGFEGSALDIAARAYRRECKWDFSPGDGGVWLIVLRPTSWSGSEEHEQRWSASGNLVGFLILQDLDEDGEYESVAHICWTAVLWRRRGIAAHLLEQACARFPVVAIEGPPTELGAALVSARAAHLGSR